MATYTDLTRLMPRTASLSGLMALARELDISLSHEPPAEPSDQWGREWERFSLYHLLDGLGGANMTAEFADNNSRDLVAEDHWEDFARAEAEDLGEIDNVATYVDWKRYASDVRVDYACVVIDAGEFQGTWYARG